MTNTNTAKELTREEIERFFDEELSSDEQIKIQARIDQSEKAQAYLKRLQNLRKYVQNHAQEQSQELDSEALFENIERAKHSPVASPNKPFLQILRGGGKNQSPSFLSKPIFVKYAFTFAAAAAIVITLFSLTDFNTGSDQMANNPHSTEQSPTETASTPQENKGESVVHQNEKTDSKSLALAVHQPTSTPHSASTPHLEVIAVDFGQNTGTVFTVEGDDDPTTVIWIEEFN